MEYKPIRIVRDFSVSVALRETALRDFPHGTIGTVPVMKDWKRLPTFTVSYYHPQRIDAPTPEERRVLLGAKDANGKPYALEIPQHKELKCDSPDSPLSGSRKQAKRRRRKAALEDGERTDERKREAKEKESEAETGSENPITDKSTAKLTEVKSDERD